MEEPKSEGAGLLNIKPRGKLIAELYEDGDKILLHPIIPVPFLELANLLSQLASAYVQMEMKRQQSQIVLSNSIPGLHITPGNGKRS